jgi:Uma2 family endonuclease
MSVGFDHSSAIPAPAVVFPVRRVTVEEYHRLADLGVLTEDDRVELLEGVISPKMVDNPPHDGTVDLVDETLSSRLPAGWRTRIQSAITTEDSEPEPDVAVVRGEARDYLERHPGPADIGLLVEVADSTLDRDRDKRRIYARAGIDIYWIINLVDACVEVYSEPSCAGAEPTYAQAEKYTAGEAIPFVVGGEALGSIRVADLLP